MEFLKKNNCHINFPEFPKIDFSSLKTITSLLTILCFFLSMFSKLD